MSPIPDVQPPIATHPLSYDIILCMLWKHKIKTPAEISMCLVLIISWIAPHMDSSFLHCLCIFKQLVVWQAYQVAIRYK